MRRLYQTLFIVCLVAPATTALAQKVEYFWDTDPGVGKGTVLQTFKGSEAQIDAELDAGGLSAGVHVLGLRAINTASAAATPGSVAYCSATYHRPFYVPAAEEQIVRIEYSWDKDVAVGQGTSISFTRGTTVDLSRSLSTSRLTPGMHTLYLRAVSTNHFSQTYTRQFYVPPTVHKVEAIEYFYDDDPGVGRATRMAATLTGDSLTKAFDVSTAGLSEGVHHIGLRTLTDGTWSATMVRQFLVSSGTREDYVARLEYFWNADPGQGRAYVVDITPGKEVSLDFEADMTMLGAGPHTLGLRAQSGSQGWSATKLVTGIEFEGWDNLQDYLNSLDDTQDVLTATQYSREFGNNDWHALYVPFTLTYSDWADHFDVARINAFYQYDDDEDGVVDRQVLEAIIVRSGTLKANHPYLIRAKQKGTFTLPAGNGRVTPQENSVSCSTMEARYTFTGNYAQLKNLKTNGRYRLRGTSLSIPDTDDEVLPPYRWYLTIDNLGNQLQPSASRSLQLRFVGEEEATGIAEMESGSRAAADEVYDLQGRRVDASTFHSRSTVQKKGIYIINNKKYFVK